MARHLFGLAPADLAMEAVGDELRLRPGAVGTVWTARTGGSQLTDLLDRDAVTPITVVTADADAIVGFYGPDPVALVWVDFGFGRFAMTAIDLGTIVENKLDLTSGGSVAGPVVFTAGIQNTGLTDLDGALTVAGAASFADDVSAVGDLFSSGGVIALNGSAAVMPASMSGLDGQSSITRLVSNRANSSIQVVSSGNFPVEVWTNSIKRWDITGAGLIRAGDVVIDSPNSRLGVGITAGPSFQLHVRGPSSSTAKVMIETSGTAALNRAMSIKAQGEAQDRFTYDFDGKIQWGDGASSPDVNLFRDAANVLRTNDALTVDGVLSVAGGIVQSAGLGATVFARKTADQTKTNTTALAADTHLTVAVESGATYEVEVALVFATPAAADLKTDFTYPSGSSLRLLVAGTDPQAGRTIVGTGTDSPDDPILVTDTADHSVIYKGLLRVGGTAGSFALRWAQNTADVGTSTMRTDSYMRLRRVA